MTRLAAEVIAQQRAEGGLPPKAEVPTVVNTDSTIDQFLTEFAGGGGATFIRFTKGQYLDRDGGSVPLKTEFVCPFEQIQIGWIRFNGKGNLPTRHMGPLFGGFMPPSRTDLGDQDKSLWENGPNGEPADPWQMQMVLPLVEPNTGEPYIFATTSVTGRNAVGKLVQSCKQLRRKSPDVYPVVRLDVGGYQHRDPRIGWVPVPAFPVVGQAPKDGTALPDTSVAADLNDDIPW